MNDPPVATIGAVSDEPPKVADAAPAVEEARGSPERAFPAPAAELEAESRRQLVTMVLQDLLNTPAVQQTVASIVRSAVVEACESQTKSISNLEQSINSRIDALERNTWSMLKPVNTEGAKVAELRRQATESSLGSHRPGSRADSSRHGTSEYGSRVRASECGSRVEASRVRPSDTDSLVRAGTWDVVSTTSSAAPGKHDNYYKSQRSGGTHEPTVSLELPVATSPSVRSIGDIRPMVPTKPSSACRSTSWSAGPPCLEDLVKAQNDRIIFEAGLESVPNSTFPGLPSMLPGYGDSGAAVDTGAAAGILPGSLLMPPGGLHLQLPTSDSSRKLHRQQSLPDRWPPMRWPSPRGLRASGTPSSPSTSISPRPSPRTSAGKNSSISNRIRNLWGHGGHKGAGPGAA